MLHPERMDAQGDLLEEEAALTVGSRASVELREDDLDGVDGWVGPGVQDASAEGACRRLPGPEEGGQSRETGCRKADGIQDRQGGRLRHPPGNLCARRSTWIFRTSDNPLTPAPLASWITIYRSFARQEAEARGSYSTSLDGIRGSRSTFLPRVGLVELGSEGAQRPTCVSAGVPGSYRCTASIRQSPDSSMSDLVAQAVRPRTARIDKCAGTFSFPTLSPTESKRSHRR